MRHPGSIDDTRAAARRLFLLVALALLALGCAQWLAASFPEPWNAVPAGRVAT